MKQTRSVFTCDLCKEDLTEDEKDSETSYGVSVHEYTQGYDTPDTRNFNECHKACADKVEDFIDSLKTNKVSSPKH